MKIVAQATVRLAMAKKIIKHDRGSMTFHWGKFYSVFNV